MSLEAEMQELRSKQQTLDHALQELMKVAGGTHEVVTLTLKDQLEMHKENREMRQEIKQQSKRCEKMEELLIQIVNNPANK